MALKQLPTLCDFSRYCKRLTQARADTYDRQRHHGDRDSLLLGATKFQFTQECVLLNRQMSFSNKNNNAQTLYSHKKYKTNFIFFINI